MKVAIVGAGKLGVKVATALLGGDHYITVIDKNEAVLNRISQQMDVMTVAGNGKNIKRKVYRRSVLIFGGYVLSIF